MLNKKFKSPLIGAIAGLGGGLIGVYIAVQISKYVLHIPRQDAPVGVDFVDNIWIAVLGVLIIIVSILLNKKKE